MTTGPASPARRYVAVIGGGEADADTLAVAEAVGRAVAGAGAVLVCGGLTGVMEAACRGAHAAGGLTVGVLPGRDRAAANPHVDVALATGLGEARNTIVVRAADAVVAVGGGFGTLSEIGFALKIGVPVVGLRTWQVRPPGDPLERDVVEATDPTEAVELALRLAQA